MDAETPYFERLAAAYVRGRREGARPPPTPDGDPPEAGLPDEGLRTAPLGALTDHELAELVTWGRAQGLRMHRFKRTMGLARVREVLGWLRGLTPESLLDVGSGRGAFLWPLLEEHPELAVTAVDRNPSHLEYLGAVARGGVANLRPVLGDATRLPLADDAVDGVTLLEVLEHLVDPAPALAEAARVARRFVLLSVPSREDDNPEHLHLLTPDKLRPLCADAGLEPPRIGYVHNHLVAQTRPRKGA